MSRETAASPREVVEQVAVGTTVEVESEGQVERWTICRVGDSKPDLGVVSEEAPLARALLGAHQGESRSYVVGTRTWLVSVRRIRRAVQ